MNKKIAVFLLCVAASAASAFTVATRKSNSVLFSPPSQAATATPSATSTPGSQPIGVSPSPQQGGNAPPPGQSEVVPQYVIYELLFREIAAFKKKAEEEEQQGRNGSSLRAHHQRKIKLNDQQAKSLDKLVDKINDALEKLDAKANKIIDDIRARHPDGKLKPGEQLPAPPQELEDLQQQRINLVLQARDELQTALGQAEFQRFDEFMRQDMMSKIRPVHFQPGRPLPSSIAP